MKITRIISGGMLLVLFLAFTGCMGTAVKFKTMPDQPYDSARGREVKGSACGFQFWLVVPLMINDRAERAYDDMILAAAGDYVTNIKVNERWIYALIGTAYCTDMQGTAYPKVASSVVPVAQEINKVSSIDECIKACKENTKRTPEECFEACKR